MSAVRIQTYPCNEHANFVQLTWCIYLTTTWAKLQICRSMRHFKMVVGNGRINYRYFQCIMLGFVIDGHISSYTDSSANQPDSPVDDDTDELSSNKKG